jgi:hypothetical protein
LDIRLLDLADAEDSDGHSSVQQKWSGFLDEYPMQLYDAKALFLTRSDCEGIQYHKVFRQTVFRSAYKIKGSKLAEEITTIDASFPDHIMKTEESISLLKISTENVRFSLFPEIVRKGFKFTTHETVISFCLPVTLDISIDNLCVTEVELLKLTQIVKSHENGLPKGSKLKVYFSQRMKILERVVLECWKQPITESKKDEFPNDSDVVLKLINTEYFSKTLAEKAALIIRPDQAKRFNTAPESDDFISSHFDALITVAAIYWSEQPSGSVLLGPTKAEIMEILINNHNFKDYLADAGADIDS